MEKIMRDFRFHLVDEPSLTDRGSKVRKRIFDNLVSYIRNREKYIQDTWHERFKEAFIIQNARDLFICIKCGRIGPYRFYLHSKSLDERDDGKMACDGKVIKVSALLKRKRVRD